MNYDVIIVGGGIAGLTSAAYLSKSGHKVLLCEKEPKVGGLVNSFEYKGFTFDGGIRALENSGIVNPMLQQLGIEVPSVKNIVSIGVGDEMIRVESKESLDNYKLLLQKMFPDNIDDIENIMNEIEKIMVYMDILYGIHNPLFVDFKENQEFYLKTVLPWMFKFMKTINKIDRLNEPVDEYLKTFTSNEALIDMIAQHFFTKTPTFFALSYFSLYLEYEYPIGGTGALIDKMRDFIIAHQGEIKTNTMITQINPESKTLIDHNQVEYHYNQLIWTGDVKRLYDNVHVDEISHERVKQKVISQKEVVSDKVGGDSILTLYATVDLDKSFFETRCSEHCFYTPLKDGINKINIKLNEESSKEEILAWLQQYLKYTTYEISIPVMKDASLAPTGKTGLIISTLMDHSLVKSIQEMGAYEAFKAMSAECMIEALEQSIFKGFKQKVMDQFVATPLTLQRYTDNSDGAITGWSFTNSSVPAVSKMTNVAKSVLTPIPHVYQAGQWTFSPSGLPISILTGKLASNAVSKRMKRSK